MKCCSLCRIEAMAATTLSELAKYVCRVIAGPASQNASPHANMQAIEKTARMECQSGTLAACQVVLPSRK